MESLTVNLPSVNNIVTLNGSTIALSGDVEDSDITYTAPGNDNLPNIIINGGGGDNLYAFAGSASMGNVTIGTPFVAGIDTLDFSGLTPSADSSGVTIDLNSSLQQSVTDDGRLNLTLVNPTLFVTVDGSLGNDTIRGNSRGDNIYESGGNNYLYVISGDNTLVAGSGTDTLYAGSGNDTLIAGSGTDTLVGGAGNDIFLAGTGNDQFIGGTGNNSYAFDPVMAHWAMTPLSRPRMHPTMF